MDSPSTVAVNSSLDSRQPSAKKAKQSLKNGSKSKKPKCSVQSKHKGVTGVIEEIAAKMLDQVEHRIEQEAVEFVERLFR